MLAGKPGLLHCHMGAGGPPCSGAAPTLTAGVSGGNGRSGGSAGAASDTAERDLLAPLFDAVAHSDVPVRTSPASSSSASLPLLMV